MSCVSHALPAVVPTRVPFSWAGPAIRYIPSGSFASIFLIGVSAFSGSTVSKNSSLRPNLPSEPLPLKVSTLPAGPRTSSRRQPALSTNPWKPVSRSVALCSMLSLASLSGTGARKSVADRAGASSAERKPTYTDTAASRARDVGPRIFMDASGSEVCGAATVGRHDEAGMRGPA